MPVFEENGLKNPVQNTKTFYIERKIFMTEYKTLTNEEYNLLNKIATKTKCDCWFSIRQDEDGTDYVFDIEEGKRMSLKAGFELLCEAINRKENNCDLTLDEEETFNKLFDKLDVLILF